MSKDFPSIWLETSEPNKESTFISGFYRQWTYKGIKSDALQIEQMKKFANQIDTVAKKCSKIIITGDANLYSTKWNNENFLNKKLQFPSKTALSRME